MSSQRISWRYPRGVCLAGLLATAVPVSAAVTDSLLADPGSLLQGQRGKPDHFASLAVIEPATLDGLRGGFSIGGVNLSFGATARTMIDGVMLQTVFQVDQAGSQIVSQQVITGAQEAAAVASEARAPSVSLAIQDFLSRFSVPVAITTGSASAQSGGSAATASAGNGGATANTGNGASASVQGAGGGTVNPALTGTPVANLGGSIPAGEVGVSPAATANPAGTSGGGGGSVSGGSLPAAAGVTATVSDLGPSTIAATTTNGTASPVTDSHADTSTSSPSAVTTSGSQVVLVGPQSGTSVSQVAPAEVVLSGVADFSGVVIQDARGFTAALHQLTQEAVRSAVISNRSGQQIRNELEIQIDVEGVREAAAASLRSSIMESVHSRIGQ